MTVKIKLVETVHGDKIAVVEDTELIITDEQSALDTFMEIRYTAHTDRIVLNKTNFTEEFFNLSTCLAGEILQKAINYQFKIAIVGDYSEYNSAALQALIRESNRGKDYFFVDTISTAIDMLSKV